MNDCKPQILPFYHQGPLPPRPLVTWPEFVSPPGQMDGWRPRISLLPLDPITADSDTACFQTCSETSRYARFDLQPARDSICPSPVCSLFRKMALRMNRSRDVDRRRDGPVSGRVFMAQGCLSCRCEGRVLGVAEGARRRLSDTDALCVAVWAVGRTCTRCPCSGEVFERETGEDGPSGRPSWWGPCARKRGAAGRVAVFRHATQKTSWEVLVLSVCHINNPKLVIH